MRKLLAFVVIAGTLAFAPTAQAATGITICHYNGDGTYTAKALSFTNSSDALRLAEYTDTGIVYHINDTPIVTDPKTQNIDASDIWPAFTYSDQFTQTNVAASHNWLKYTYTSWYVTVNRVRRLVWGWLWLPNAVTQGIYNRGCVA